jgi:hypothetical protein
MSEMDEKVLDEAMESSTEENASETKEDENVTSKKQPKQQRTLMQKLPKRIPKILIKRNLFSKRRKTKRMSRSRSLPIR